MPENLLIFDRQLVIMITVTELAATKARSMMEKSGKQGGLRIKVVPGGCSGFSYDMGFDEQKEGDIVIEQNGMKFLFDQQAVRFMQGSRIDYTDSLSDAGFKIDNPNFTHSCGCGKSFG